MRASTVNSTAAVDTDRSPGRPATCSVFPVVNAASFCFLCHSIHSLKIKFRMTWTGGDFSLFPGRAYQGLLGLRFPKNDMAVFEAVICFAGYSMACYIATWTPA